LGGKGGKDRFGTGDRNDEVKEFPLNTPNSEPILRTLKARPFHPGMSKKLMFSGFGSRQSLAWGLAWVLGSAGQSENVPSFHVEKDFAPKGSITSTTTSNVFPGAEHGASVNLQAESQRLLAFPGSSSVWPLYLRNDQLETLGLEIEVPCSDKNSPSTKFMAGLPMNPGRICSPDENRVPGEPHLLFQPILHDHDPVSHGHGLHWSWVT